MKCVKLFTHLSLAVLLSISVALAQEVAHVLTQRQLCDLELILNGGFAPLTTFMGEQDYNGCVENMRLADGSLWPMPIVLDVNEQMASQLEIGSTLILKEEDILGIVELV